MVSKPCVERVSPTIEMAAFVVFCERARPRYFRHVGDLWARSLSPVISRGGAAAQASNRAQSLAEIVTIRRSTISISAASSALRRTKSLTFVRAYEEAASKSVRSWSLNRTLNTDDAMGKFPVLLSVGV